MRERTVDIASTLAGEVKPLLPTSKDSNDDSAGWSARRIAVIVVTTGTYVIGIMPVHISIPLVPILEDDSDLLWSKSNTHILLSVVPFMEAIGLIALGPLADACGGACAMSWYLGTAAVALVCVAVASEPRFIIAAFMVGMLLRGIAWPAVTKILSENLAASQWEVGLCAIGIASRTGAWMTSEFTGVVTEAVGWRGAVCFVAMAACLGAGMMQAVRACTERRSEGVAVSSAASFGSLLAGQLSTTFRGLIEFFGWSDSLLILCFVICQQPLWAFGNFLGAFAHDIYGMSPTDSARASGAYPAGQVAGLVCALLAVLSGGPKRRRSVYQAMAWLAVGAALIPIYLLMSLGSLGHREFVFLAGLQGFCSVTLDYIPPSIWCMYLGRDSGKGALYMSALYCIASLALTVWSFCVGVVRNHSEHAAFQVVMGMASFCALASTCLLFVHIHRNDRLFDDK
mmetsp:Transcript_152632/g.489468  ORF Transcript_152632/g.489468 Transcript_152632/m.489468 type:complete len:456 (-) Transcript_152632:156-1523(-)